MYLEKLEVQGFKSFANKNKLIFPGMINKDRRGLTAVVGPNGSGKSNIADAVRWALGEQSMKTLRGKKSEDIIFSGSDKKGKMGMAEVSLYLNNEDKKAPIDYSEVVLTRRLFRDGESEYLINQARVRLSDIQMLLAKAKFGQRTYSVIGQGTVEGFLNTSLAERKEFFDEATGVKQFQIKRDDALNKLETSHENLYQVEMLLSEIEPRLKSLTRQVSRLERREKIEAELKVFQLNYFRTVWHEVNDKFRAFNNDFLELEKNKIVKEKKLEQMNRELEKIEAKDKKSFEYEKWQALLVDLQEKKEAVLKQLARLEAEFEIGLETKGQFDLSWLNNKKAELAREIKNVHEEIESLEKNIKLNEELLGDLGKTQDEVEKELRELNNTLNKLSAGAGNQEKFKIHEVLKSLLLKLEEAGAEMDVEKIKEIIRKIKEEFRETISRLEKDETKEQVNDIQGQIIELTKKKGEITGKINETNLKASAWRERLKLLEEKKGGGEREIKEIEIKLEKSQFQPETAETRAKRKELKEQLEKIEAEVKEINGKISNLNLEEEREKTLLFALQKNIHSLQNELNDLNRRLSELKINSTRQETRLESIEAEARRDLGGLKEIKDNRNTEQINLEEAQEKISQLKHQLELIGGIDPETAKEYAETKERFDFLSGQVKDLSEAIKSLEKIVEELDITIKERFDKEFKIISEKFEEYFKILFNGGVAKIVKVVAEEMSGEAEVVEPKTGVNQENNIPEKNLGAKKIKFLKKHNATGLAGIEIQATPPGKKIRSIAMLSGGERALTAIALICAIISANPSPFVVLDEVDAALDESNSERLAKILDDLSHKTQFIVITHNRASMRRANVLYGVTMGDDGISKLLSVKLEEVKAAR